MVTDCKGSWIQSDKMGWPQLADKRVYIALDFSGSFEATLLGSARENQKNLECRQLFATQGDCCEAMAGNLWPRS